ncbi:MAG: Ig-like domain-containing protein [Sulfuricurvum sp.]|uniref:Ig-like domain-containing protein n=1 Tax=Sulfuricurvum sp. TaxID=2025608 RepID=UPI0027356753|nr:Ig-like domain-containing protein [Sulfuricurvum sp.]MDP2849793.1 Ig-like domain-containing protein [Sulfuricurvum sp.]
MKINKLFLRWIAVFGMVMVMSPSGWCSDACSNTTDHSFTVSGVDSNYTDSYSGNQFDNGDNEYYYFNIPSAGTLTFTRDADNDVAYKYHLSSCPDNSTGTVLNNNNTITFTGATDFNMRIKSTANNQVYAFSFNFVPNATAVNDSYITGKNSVLSENILTNDMGDSLSVITNTAPSHGVLALDANGSFTYTPEVDYLGNDSFTYTIQDGFAHTSTGTVNIIVKLPEIGWEQVVYQTSENTTLPYGGVSQMPMKISLDTVVEYPISVMYTTYDLTAIGDSDYRIAGGSVTIPAGQTEVTVNMDIYHDEIIELTESFRVTLSNPTGSGGVSLKAGYDIATASIMEQLTAPMCYNDTFSTELDEKWRTLYSNGTFTPQINSGHLKLTPGKKNIATAVTKDYEFPSQGNLIIVEFTHYAYGGCFEESPAEAGLGTYGADGVVAVLYDSAVGASPTPGAYGGSMGYAQGHGNPGFQGGWLGLGLDEYGNFANPTEDRVGGPGFHTNAAVIRGDGSGMSGYEFLQEAYPLTTPIAPEVDYTNPAKLPGDKFRLTVDARDNAHLYIRLERDTGSGYVTIINGFDAKNPVYNQTTTPALVRFALTSGTGGGCNAHEIDDLTVWGRCTPYNPIPPTPPSNTGAVDVVDNYPTNGYTARTGLKTKITSKTDANHFLDAVWLGTGGGSSAIPYYTAGNNDVVDMPVLFYVSDINTTDDNGSCTAERYQIIGNNGQPLISTFSAGDTYARTTSTYTIQAQAKKHSKIVPKYINFYGMNLIDPSITCLVNSSNSGNIEGMPQCVNSGSQYLQAFGQAAVDRCRGTLNGAPCEPANHGIGTGVYAHNYGCYQCTLDALGTKGCSSDAYAIRPNKFTITSNSSHWPDLLTSASDYNITLQALTFQNGLTNDYNVTNARNILELNTSARYYPNNVLDTTNGLVGFFSMGTGDFNMSNGISVKSGIVSNEVMPVNFSDVGKMTLQVIDKVWSAIDNDDSQLNCNGTFICGNTNATYIPSTFNISTLRLSNNNGNPGTFTYLARIGDDEATLKMMSGRFDLNVSAQNNNGAITRNFRQGAWEKSVTITPIVFDNLHGDANETVINNLAIGFGSGGDENGTKYLAWNETNSSLMLRFNFNKSPTITVNPFSVNGNETNVSIISFYTGTAPIGDRNVSGSRIENADQNVTFVYGRIVPRDVRVFGNVGFTANAWYEVFNTPTLAGTGLAPSRNSSQWFINILHNDNNDGDGNITRIQNNSNGTVTTVNMWSNEVNGMETYTLGPIAPTYSGKAHINTDPWLWYGINALEYSDPSNPNLDCQTHPCFNINVVPNIGTAGSSTNTKILGSDKANKGTSRGTGVTYDYTPATR